MKRKIFSLFGLIVLSILLFGMGVWVGQAQTGSHSGWMMGSPTNNIQAGYGMMGGTSMMNQADTIDHTEMMGTMMNTNMMANHNLEYMSGMMNGQVGSMMGSAEMTGMMSAISGLSEVEPLTISEAETAVADYLATTNQENLTIGEIMIFSNHAYAQILDSATGQGAFELLVDPATGNVYPEPGPNMMWNTDSGIMSGSSMPGQGMMGSYGSVPNGAITVTADEAVGIAQDYLDGSLPGKTAGETADTFPGYYTLHILEDGKTIGMLSVNAYSGQVFLHHWHGEFIEMTENN